jgi:hypothetical protein
MRIFDQTRPLGTRATQKDRLRPLKHWCGVPVGVSRGQCVALEQARADLIAAVRARLGDREKDFLVSFKRGEPRWELLGVSHAPDLPAVRWKLHNLERMGEARRKAAVEELERALQGA